MAGEACPSPLIDLAQSLADASGRILRRHFRSPGLVIDDKPDASPVTIADREAELAIRELLARAHPDHGVVGEEFPPDRPDADFVWVLDPIDGTKGFLSGKPLFGTLIALLRAGRPILGVIDHPALRERWVGALGHPTRHNGEPVSARICGDLRRAVLYASSPEQFEGADRTRFERLRRAVRINGWGADCYAYGLLASGFIDLVAEASMGPYDYLPLVAVVEGAGGRITDWQGAPLGLRSDGRTLAAGDPSAHRVALEKLAESG